MEAQGASNPGVPACVSVCAVYHSEYMSPYCGANQSHTHYTGAINAKACQQLCPRPQAYQCVGMIVTLPTWRYAVSIYVLNVPMLHHFDAWVLSDAVIQQRF